MWPASKRGTEEYARAVEHLQKKHGQLPAPIGQTTSRLKLMNDAMLRAAPGGHMLATAMTGTAGAILAAGAAALVATRQMSRAAAKIDETAKAARVAGMAYGDLVAVQMLASEVSGVDAAAVNKGVRELSKRLAEARANGGQLNDALAAVGINVAQLAQADPAEQWRQVSEVIAGIPSKAEQIRIATLALGRDGARMVDTFRQGGGALDDMRGEAQRLGAVLSDEAAAEVEAMNDAFGRARMAIDGMSASAVADLSPVLTKIAKLIEEIAVGLRSSKNAADGVGSALGPALTIIEKMVDGLRFIVAFSNDMRKNMLAVPKWIVGGDFEAGFENSSRFLDEMDAAAAGVANSTAKAAAGSEELAIDAERAAEAARKIDESYQSRANSLAIESAKLAGNVQLAREMELAAEGYSKEQAASLIAMEKQNATIKERIEAEEQAAKDREQAAKDAAAQMKRDIDEFKRELAEIDRAFEKEVESAMTAATAYYEQQRKQDEQRRKDIASGPGAGMEVGSAEAAKFMADQVNRSIADAVVPEKPTPGEKEIADKTRELLIAQREANAKQAEQLAEQKKLLAEFRENRFTRAR